MPTVSSTPSTRPPRRRPLRLARYDAAEDDFVNDIEARRRLARRTLDDFADHVEHLVNVKFGLATIHCMDKVDDVELAWHTRGGTQFVRTLMR